MSTFALGSFAVATFAVSVLLSWLASPGEPGLPDAVSVAPWPPVERIASGAVPAVADPVRAAREAAEPAAASVADRSTAAADQSGAAECLAIAAALRDPSSSRDAIEDAMRRLGSLLAGQRGSDAAANAGLLACEALAVQHGLLLTWLEALGGSRHAAAHSAVQRHLATAEPDVRAAAVAAFVRQAPTAPATLERLQDLAVGDPSPLVRMRAVANLAAGRDAGVLRTLTAVLDRESALEVRHAALLALVHVADRATAMPILQRIAAGDPDAGTRALANELLARRA